MDRTRTPAGDWLGWTPGSKGQRLMARRKLQGGRVFIRHHRLRDRLPRRAIRQPNIGPWGYSITSIWYHPPDHLYIYSHLTSKPLHLIGLPGWCLIFYQGAARNSWTGIGSSGSSQKAFADVTVHDWPSGIGGTLALMEGGGRPPPRPPPCICTCFYLVNTFTESLKPVYSKTLSLIMGGWSDCFWWGRGAVHW